MKNIYLVLTHTGTVLSNLIKLYTRDEFSHSSIALDSELKEMYSFGRLKPRNPFIGGFVHEYIDSGTFKRFKNTTTKVYEVNVTDEQYMKIKNLISEFEKHKEEYKFNTIGLFLVAAKMKYNREKCFYCAEFVKYLLQETNVENNLPKYIRPENFKKIENKELVYSGLIRDYKYENLKEIENIG